MYPSLKLTASPASLWKLLIGRLLFKIPNGHRLVFTLGFVLGISMFIPLTGGHPLDWRFIPLTGGHPWGQTMFRFSPRRRKMVFKYFLEPVRKSLRNCSSMAIKWGRFPHFSKFGPKAAGDANCWKLHDERDQKHTKIWDTHSDGGFSCGAINPCGGGEQSSHYGQEDDCTTPPPKEISSNSPNSKHQLATRVLYQGKVIIPYDSMLLPFLVAPDCFFFWKCSPNILSPLRPLALRYPSNDNQRSKRVQPCSPIF